jgi:hypothetical protein
MACVRPFKHLPGSFQRHLKGFCEMTPAQIMGLFTKASLILAGFVRDSVFRPQA